MDGFVVGNTEATPATDDPAMDATYRFRLEVADRPGMLARITDVLAAAGGNVASIDIHQPDEGVAVDEIVVTAPEGWAVGEVAATLDTLDGARVLHARVDHRTGDPVVNALSWARVMVAADPATHQLELTRAILEVTGAVVAWTAEPDGTQRQPTLRQVPSLPPEVGSGLDGPAWLLAVPDDDTEPQMVAFAARPIGARFSASEVARLDALVRLRRALLAAARVPT